MANLNLEDFSEEYRKTAPMECSLYFSFLFRQRYTNAVKERLE